MFIVKERAFDSDYYPFYEYDLGYLVNSADFNKLANVKGYEGEAVHGEDCEGSISFSKENINEDGIKAHLELVLIPLEEIKVK